MVQRERGQWNYAKKGIFMLKILHLYPEHMNLYGDRGNVLALRQRAEWRGIPVEVVNAGPGDDVDWSQVHLVFMGGGEDVHQARVAPDFLARGAEISQVLENGCPMLAICGGYQLLGHYYRTQTGEELPGIGFLDVRTEPGEIRAVGDVVTETTLPIQPQTLVGFENHGGLTFLGPNAKPLAKVQQGRGNNGRDGTEGAVRNHVVGTYLHGSLLPKNPHLTDQLLTWALAYAGIPITLAPLDDSSEWKAHQVIVGRRKSEALSTSR